MKKRPQEPVIPRTAQETTRHAIMALLSEGPISAAEISAAVGLPEKEVSGHLDHIRRSLHVTGAVLEVEPAECRHEAICDPLFSIRGLPEQEAD